MKDTKNQNRKCNKRYTKFNKQSHINLLNDKTLKGALEPIDEESLKNRTNKNKNSGESLSSQKGFKDQLHLDQLGSYYNVRIFPKLIELLKDKNEHFEMYFKVPKQLV